MLRRIEADGAYANLALPAALGAASLSPADRALATELVYGTTRMRRACDFLVDRFLLRDPDPEVRTLLRLGAYQLHFTAIADHAAVSETVELAGHKAKGFVNAILRKVATAPVNWPDDATRLSYPDWIVDRLVTELGAEDALAAMEMMSTAPEVTRRADGYVQDRASTWVAEAVDAQPGELVADLCAAPGGKATALAATGATVIACDLQLHRLGLVRANAPEMALVAADATRPPLRAGAFDRVLVDAPCSGLGALRRRPDARWRIRPVDIDELAALQQRILDAARVLVRPGGVLVWSVCTLTAAESIQLDASGLEAIEPIPSGACIGAPWRPYGDGARLLPQDAGTDGMTIRRWRRP